MRFSYPTRMPIERAVPAICLLAASRSLALRSGILVRAISASCSSVTVPTRFFAMCELPLPVSLELGDLAELELDRRLAAEDVHQDLELELVLVDLRDLAREIGEGTLANPDALAHVVLEPRPGLLRCLRSL